MKVTFLPFFAANPYQSSLATALAALGAEVHCVPLGGRWRRVFPILRALRRFGVPGILHLHWLHPLIGGRILAFRILFSVQTLFELIVCRMMGVRIVWTVHNLTAHESNGSRLERFATRLIVPLLNAVIVHCNYARSRFLEQFPGGGKLTVRTFMVPHASYVGVYPDVIERDAARIALGIRGSEKVFLFFGFIRAYKGVGRLVEVFRQVHESNVRLLVVGNCADGNIATDLLTAAAKDERVALFLRYIPQDEVQVFMNAADVVVLPFTDVLTSGSAILGMSFGKGIVAPRFGCLCETIHPDGRFLYNPRQENALLESLLAAMSADLPKMGAANREAAAALTWKVAAEHTFKIYCSL